MALYSWAADRRACRAHVRHFIADAIERREWALNRSPEWRRKASTWSNDGANKWASQTVRQMARDALDYARHRAFMRGAYEGWPGDKPARDLWQALQSGTPARFYSFAAGDYVERVGGAAKEGR